MKRVITSNSEWKSIRFEINTYCPYCRKKVSFSNEKILKIVSLKCRNCEKDFDVVTRDFD